MASHPQASSYTAAKPRGIFNLAWGVVATLLSVILDCDLRSRRGYRGHDEQAARGHPRSRARGGEGLSRFPVSRWKSRVSKILPG